MAHLDLSGMLQTSEQVTKVVKALKKQSTVLAVHLNCTTVIAMDRKLQEYIKIKLHLHGEIMEDSHQLMHTKPKGIPANDLSQKCNTILDKNATPFQYKAKLQAQVLQNRQLLDYYANQDNLAPKKSV
jgi:hypothetical protein